MKIAIKVLLCLVFAVPFAALGYYSLLAMGILPTDTAIAPIQVFPDMQIQAARQALSASDFFPDSASLRPLPEGAIAIGRKAYPFAQTEFDSAVNTLADPVPDCPAALVRGKIRFETFCSHCHGTNGDATGSVITKVQPAEGEEGFPAPPSYHRKETVALPKSRIFHIISSGQNAMFAVADRLPEIDRWCIAKYVKQLQSADTLQISQ